MGSVSSTPAALVVEDEVIVRLHIADIVEGAGFTTVEAFNADEAIELLTSRSDIQFVITEITCRVPWTVSSWLMQYEIAGHPSKSS